MKLLQKTSRVYVLFSAMLLFVIGCLLYAAITTFVEQESEEKLSDNRERIKRRLEKGETVSQLPPIIEIEELPYPRFARAVEKDTTLFDPITGEPEPFREITSFESINGRNYRITVRQINLEPHDYYGSIGLALAFGFVMLFVGLVLINKRISSRLWKPFYANLETLKGFSVEEGAPIAFLSSNITEFQEMNRAILRLMEKARAEYHTLKEFSENASHEMQTPLSIIQTKLDEALQSPDLTEDQSRSIKDAFASSQRLARLNQALLLLTKIENRQFTSLETIYLETKIEEQLKHFEDFVRTKNVVIEKHLQKYSTLKANPLLIEILLSNLIGNAIRHNIQRGKMSVVLKDGSLTISNTGKTLTVPTKRLFERFIKEDPASESLGLGLAIVKRICDTAGWKLDYLYVDGWHTVTIAF